MTNISHPFLKNKFECIRFEKNAKQLTVQWTNAVVRLRGAHLQRHVPAMFIYIYSGIDTLHPLWRLLRQNIDYRKYFVLNFMQVYWCIFNIKITINKHLYKTANHWRNTCNNNKNFWRWNKKMNVSKKSFCLFYGLAQY